jgi:hypothetical protein
LVDQTRVLETEITLAFDGALSGVVTVAGCRCDLGSVCAVYLRPYASSFASDSAPMTPVAAQERGHALWVEDTISLFSELTPALVINRLSSMASNGSKPFQGELIRAAGFAVPDTLVTTDVEALQRFRAQHERVIYKSTSGVRSIVAELGPEHASRLQRITHCPTQFQQYIPGHDYRAHVVGSDVFVHEIVSDAVDYRYASARGDAIVLRAADLPQDVAERCISLTASLGLTVAGVDLRRTPEGQWFCFEVNPSPGFVFYDREHDEPIAEAIASLLVTASHTPQPAHTPRSQTAPLWASAGAPSASDWEVGRPT